MTKKPLILLDIDETVLGKDYRTNSSHLPDKIRDLIDAGWLVGLNSDTPIQRINRSANEWGCNGPMVVEYGSAVYEKPFPVTAELPDFAWPDIDPTTQLFDVVTKEFLLFLRCLHGKLNVFVGDPLVGLDCIRRMTEIRESWVIVNGFRRHSLSFLVRRLGDDGTLKSDQLLLKALAEEAQDIYLRSFYHGSTTPTSRIDPLLDINLDYGICIMHRPEASKRRAVPYLTEHYGPIVMIGNSMSDFLADSRIVQCAVANANKTYKELCSYVAPFDLTIGVENCLDWVKLRYKSR